MIGSCIACNEKSGGRDIVSIDHLTRRTFKLFRCVSCQIAWLDVPADLDAGAYYPQAYCGGKGYRFHPAIELLVRLFRKARARFVLRYWKRKPGRILDVGCGRAVMLAELDKLGWHCVGTEISETSSKLAGSSARVILHAEPSLETCGFPSDYFDIVTLWHVFEHLRNPVETLKEIKRILKPDGLLVIEVPNFVSWQARFNESNWIYLEAPRHFYQFSPKGLSKIIKANCFDVVYLGTLSLEIGIFGMFQSMLNLIIPRKNLFFLLMNKGERDMLDFGSVSVLFSLALVVIFALPAVVLSVFLEFASSLMGCGGVIRIVARNVK